MTQDEIIEMARQTGDATKDARGRESFDFDSYGLEAFAKLVAAKEREACAKVCEDKDAVWKKAGLWRVNHEYKECADAIRARGDA
jgi:hypothetical protein